MSTTPRVNLPNAGHFYSNIFKPVRIDLSFTVDATNGLGITSLKSNGYVRNVFMHTSTTPAANNGVTNPNPAVGYAIIQLNQNYNKFIGSTSSFISPTTGSNLTSTTTGAAYVITAVGTTTAAQWLAAGVPAGVTPAVGVGFIAIKSSSLGGNGTVKAPGSSGIISAEIVGDPNSAMPSSPSTNGGSYVLVQFLKSSFTAGAYTPAGTNSAPALTMNSYTPAGTNDGSTPPVFTGTPATLTGSVAAPTFTGTAASLTGTNAPTVAAPTAGTVINMSLIYDGSSTTIDGL